MFNKKYKKIIIVDGMQCEHCASKVTKALSNIENVSKVKVNLNTKKVTLISSDIIDNDIITNIINDLDYKVVKIMSNNK